MTEQQRSVQLREIDNRARDRKQAKSFGLQKQMRRLYIRITLGVIILLLCLYAAFLVGELSFTLSHAASTNSNMSALQTYPIQGGLVMLIITLIIAPLVGGLFGSLATRKLLQRIQELITATKQITDGNYFQRVLVTESDEIGQLEFLFNRMAEQLTESIAKQRELAGQKARLAERTRISHELHDAISQDLFSFSMLTGGLQAALPIDSPLQHQVSTLEQTARNMKREMRALLLELRPAPLDQQGLAESLQEMAAAYRTRLDLQVTTRIEPVRLAPENEEILLRIAQEAVSNAARHGGATIITVALTSKADEIELSIIDNGSGFDHEQSKQSHGLGLRFMHERVQEVGGTLGLHTTPGEGTHIAVRFRKAATT